MLSDAKGGPIDYQGRSIMMSCKVPIVKGQEVFIEILKHNDIVEQGFKVSIDQRKGSIEINNQKINTPIFWTKTAPKTFSFVCYPKKAIGIMNIWNVWKYKENIDAWIGHAGLYIEYDEDGAIVLHCSDGIKEVDFENLVFKVKIRNGHDNSSNMPKGDGS